tara:strand:- start:443 stop:622 length:180 start_codon:yes stop_codon:yes gene_type:complete
MRSGALHLGLHQRLLLLLLLCSSRVLLLLPLLLLLLLPLHHLLPHQLEAHTTAVRSMGP